MPGKLVGCALGATFVFSELPRRRRSFVMAVDAPDGTGTCSWLWATREYLHLRPTCAFAGGFPGWASYNKGAPGASPSSSVVLECFSFLILFTIVYFLSGLLR